MRKTIMTLALLAALPAAAQEPQQQLRYVPPDEVTWSEMSRALSDVAMSASAHNQIANILNSVQQRMNAVQQQNAARVKMIEEQRIKTEKAAQDKADAAAAKAAEDAKK